MIQANYSAQQTPQFRVLTEAQCRELYLAALECLKRIGVLIHHEGARQLLAENGARLEEGRVFIPPHIIQEALAATPPTFTLWGRDPRYEIRVVPGQVHFGPGPTCTYFSDPYTGERRKARRGDAALTAKVCDALENIDYVMSLSLYDDVTPVLSPVYEFADMIANTGKPIVAWANNPATLEDIYRIAAAVAGGEDALQQKPTFAYFANFESPLRHGKAQIDNMFWAADHGIPVVYLGGPSVGMESPVTGASALVIYLAGALSGLAMVQLHHRGAPMMVGGLPSAMDLRTARPSYGSPEMLLYTAAAAELAHYLGLPFMGTAGASESKLLDSQAALEVALQILVSCLSGPSLVHDVGFLDCADIGSLALLVLADEVIAMCKRMMRGVEINRQAIMLDLIERVGPGGYFMAEPETAALCRQEIWTPRLGDRNPFLIWQEKGAANMETRVNKRLQVILERHKPPALPEGAAQDIQRVLDEAEARLS